MSEQRSENGTNANGIASSCMEVSRPRSVLTQLHQHSPWGEHEIDYILFITVPSKDALTLHPHPDEVETM